MNGPLLVPLLSLAIISAAMAHAMNPPLETAGTLARLELRDGTSLQGRIRPAPDGWILLNPLDSTDSVQIRIPRQSILRIHFPHLRATRLPPESDSAAHLEALQHLYTASLPWIDWLEPEELLPFLSLASGLIQSSATGEGLAILTVIQKRFPPDSEPAQRCEDLSLLGWWKIGASDRVSHALPGWVARRHPGTSPPFGWALAARMALDQENPLEAALTALLPWVFHPHPLGEPGATECLEAALEALNRLGRKDAAEAIASQALPHSRTHETPTPTANEDAPDD